MAMNLEQMRNVYGPEYPDAVLHDGVRFPLMQERRFSRSYHSPDRKESVIISRFMDGSASITFDELRRDWSEWDESDRLDFCQECGWLNKQTDLPDILRFIMDSASVAEASAIAMSAATSLPQEEAFSKLLSRLNASKPGKSSNIAQAIALTKHPSAESTLENHLQMLVRHPELWNDSEFLNWIAFDATTCIAHLIELGVQPHAFESNVRQLALHVCERNRKSVQQFLGKHFPFLRDV